MQQAQEFLQIKGVFPLKEDGIAIVAAIVEMVVMIWLKREIALWHGQGLEATVP